MRWLRALDDSMRAGLRVERTRLEPLVALRAAAGVATVITLALWLVSPAYAASAAFGAFSAGASSFQRGWRPRKMVALTAGFGLAVSTFLGYLVAGHLALFVPLLAVWAFLAGMAWAVGRNAGIVATATVGIMLVTITLPAGIEQTLEHAAVIAFGGVVQATLILLFPIRRWGAHRDALADALAAEADYARRLRQDPTAPFDPQPLMTARSAATLTPSQARRRPRVLHGPRGVAERIRPALAALADPRVGAPAEGPGRDRARELLSAAADVLDAAARSIRHGTAIQVPARALQALRIDEEDEVLDGPARSAAAQLSRLLDEVLEIVDSRDTRAPPAAAGADGQLLVEPTMFRLVPVVVRAMRRELRPDSPVLRHAVRLGAVASLGYLLGTALPLGHGYWVPLTSVMVLRPDFHQTYARSVGRFVGTVVGVGLATGVETVHPDAFVSGGLAVGSAALTYLFMRTGYAVSQCMTAAYVVFLLGMGGEAWQQTVRDRVLLTLLGGALAMLAYVVYPAWETPRLRDRLADWLGANGRYAAAVLRAFAEPSGKGRADVRRALLDSRAANAAWAEAFTQASREPVRHRGLTHHEAEEAQDALRSLGRAAMLLESHLPDGDDARPVPQAARLADALETDTAHAARNLREGHDLKWEHVADVLDEWDTDGGEQGRVARRGAELHAQALNELSTAVSRTPLERDVEPARQERREHAEQAAR
ncbi:FUSC family protein [Streptomyces sp. NPDC005349]|uniref:FUSC family protein n=1 Tax=Streptomyces sp. NPDC005349 TaxID=3157037 RepID=UPI0033A8C645